MTLPLIRMEMRSYCRYLTWRNASSSIVQSHSWQINVQQFYILLVGSKKHWQDNVISMWAKASSSTVQMRKVVKRKTNNCILFVNCIIIMDVILPILFIVIFNFMTFYARLILNLCWILGQPKIWNLHQR